MQVTKIIAGLFRHTRRGKRGARPSLSVFFFTVLPVPRRAVPVRDSSFCRFSPHFALLPHLLSLSLVPITVAITTPLSSLSSAPMADADAKSQPPDAAASPDASISSPSSLGGGGGDAADADAIEKQLAGLGIAVAGGFPEPSGWDDGPVPVPIPADVLVGGDEGAGEKPRAPAPAPTGAVDVKVRFPRRSGEPDCSYYLKFGTCRFGMKCKFNHPARKKKTSRVCPSALDLGMVW